MKRIFVFFFVVAFLSLALARDGTGVLPASFSGWERAAQSMQVGSDPSLADAADAVVLKEYGFAGFEKATYTRSGRTMDVKAARFNDATGAYGAFTYYVQPQMQTEKIGDQAASNNMRILFYKGNILVDVTLDRVTAMSAADLRTLAEALPRPKGNVSALPVLPTYLPRQSYLPHSARYVVGPEALGRLGVPLPANLVDFGKGPEVAVARYRSSRGEASLTLISYPTPQIATERMHAMESATLPGGTFYYKRSGPIVAAVSGDIPASEAQSLLASVNYEADVTLTQATKRNPKENPGALIVGICVLIAIMFMVALILGFAFGGVRILVNKYYPNRFFDRPEQVDIIQLNLK
jgi:hypothetical protein